MTTRYNALHVVLEQPVREDDLASLQSAIRHMRGVADVVMPEENNLETSIAKSQLKFEFMQTLRKKADEFFKVE